MQSPAADASGGYCKNEVGLMHSLGSARDKRYGTGVAASLPRETPTTDSRYLLPTLKHKMGVTYRKQLANGRLLPLASSD